MDMKMTSRLAVATALTILISIPVRADVVGFSIGASYWAPELSGDISSSGGEDIDLSDDLDLDDPTTSSVALVLEHPVPMLPNLRYQNIELDSDGRNQLDGNISFEGQTYTAGETVRSDFDMSHDDIVLYYEVLDNWVNLDIGVDVKRFDGEVSIAGSTNTTRSSVDIDETIPLLYLSARFDLPFSGFYLGADLSSLSLDDSSVDDLTIVIGYHSESGLGLEGGLRTFSLELDDVEDLDSDLEYDGAFVHGFYRF